MLRRLLYCAARSSASAPGILKAGATAATSRLSSFGTRASPISSFSSSTSSTSTSSSSSTSSTPSRLAHTDLSSREDEPGQVRIDAYDASSFELSIAGKVPGSTKRRRVTGPLVLSAPVGFVARWKKAGASSYTSSSSSQAAATSIASIAALVSPRPDIVLVGTGRTGSKTSTVKASVEISEAAGGAAVEFYPTAQAASLYNVLSQEGRSVLAAMLPAGEDGS